MSFFNIVNDCKCTHKWHADFGHLVQLAAHCMTIVLHQFHRMQFFSSKSESIMATKFLFHCLERRLDCSNQKLWANTRIDHFFLKRRWPKWRDFFRIRQSIVDNQDCLLAPKSCGHCCIRATSESRTPEIKENKIMWIPVNTCK